MFKVGDIVRLKSGSPKMVVVSSDIISYTDPERYKGFYAVSWIAFESSEPRSAGYPEDALERVR